MNKFALTMLSLAMGLNSITVIADDFFGSRITPYLQMSAEELERAKLDSNSLWEMFNAPQNINLDITVKKPGKRPSYVAAGQVLSGRELKCFFSQISELKKINWNHQNVSKNSSVALFTVVLNSYEDSGKAASPTVMVNRDQNNQLTSVTTFIEVDQSVCQIVNGAVVANQL